MARPSKQVNRAEAEALLGNRYLGEHFELRRQMIFRQWEVSTSLEEREALHAELKALTNFKGTLYAAAKRAAT